MLRSWLLDQRKQDDAGRFGAEDGGAKRDGLRAGLQLRELFRRESAFRAHDREDFFGGFRK